MDSQDKSTIPNQQTQEGNSNQGSEQDNNQKSKSILDFLPPTFTQFLQENNINLEYFQEVDNFPRYVRLKPDLKISIEDLKKDLGTDQVEQIEYLTNFYSIPADIKIVNSKYYSSGQLYGIDLSSAAVIKALDPQKGDKVLDLCCCPGMKLCNIGDIIGVEGKAIGVDINETRLNTCRSIVKKYKLDKICKLELADGTSFDKESEFDRVLVDAECTHDGSLKHLAKFIQKQKDVLQDMDQQLQSKEQQSNKTNDLNQSQDKKDQQIQQKQNQKDINEQDQQSLDNSNENYDEQVQVHEKVVESKDTLNKNEQNNQNEKKNVKENNKPIQKISNRELKRRKKQMEKNNSNIYTQKKVKKNEWTLDDFQERVLDPIKLNNIVDLQKKLLTNGFKLCKEGGIIIYSTCSFARNQNEDVVEWFLQEFKGQVLSLHPFNNDTQNMPACKPGFIPNTVRFDPYVSKSGGMFVSKFQKISSSQLQQS